MATGELRIVLENIVSQVGRRKARVQLSCCRVEMLSVPFVLDLVLRRLRCNLDTSGRSSRPAVLKPTAGREALDASSNQLLQQVVSALDRLVSPIAATHSESFSTTAFSVGSLQLDNSSSVARWKSHLALPTNLKRWLRSLHGGGLRYYSGLEESVIHTYASEDEPLIVLSRRTPRRDCELGYLRSRSIQEVDTRPRVTNELEMSGLSFAHSALATRVARILEEDYFLETDIRFWHKSQARLPILVTDTNKPVVIYLDPNSTSVAPLLALYRDDFDAFDPFVKDFIRSTVFSRIAISYQQYPGGV